MELTGYQVKKLHEFMGGDFDCNVTLGRFVQERVGKDGETMPAGLYVWCTDYPEEGSVLLREDACHEPGESWQRDDERTHTMLLLCGGHDVPSEAVTGWTDEECRQAEEWAAREHLHASDNDDVERVPMPSHVKAHPPKPITAGTVGDLWS